MSQPINAPKPPFKLSQGERHSDAWLGLSKHLQERLDTLRRQNDGDLNTEQTAKIRGRIAEIKAILTLAEDNPIPPPDSP